MRIAQPFLRGASVNPMAVDQSQTSLYRALVDRCESLEASHARLREQFDEVAQENKKKKKKKKNEVVESDSACGCVPGFFVAGSPYRNMLEYMGRAVHVCRASSGEIIYWNRSAENLYGWKDYEVITQQVAELLITEECYAPLKKILDMLSSGKSWSGQFPFKKRSGEIFTAMVTKSPLYEDGELVGFITVSSDAALLFNNNNKGSENPRTYQYRSNGQPRAQGLNWKRIQWQPRPPTAPVPQIASSVSNLATKILAKLNIRGNGNCGKEEEDASIKQNGGSDLSASKKLNDPYSSRGSKTSTPHHCSVETEDNGFEESSVVACSRECTECFLVQRPGDPLPKSGCQVNEKELEPEVPNLKALETEDEMQRKADGKQLPSSGKSSSSKGDNELNSKVDCEIHWEDIHFGEEIGQGSCAVVYRGVWQGSDVAIKVYFRNEYNEGTLDDYKKEIDIMKRLRHPNVLLFIGPVCTQERLAIVTEFLPRGSLFKTLHKNNQALDIRRRLRMALDVARGMNYLHHRNPPIVHRDLKSSNLLVDRNWTVKVGDFGLSSLKNATLLSAKPGIGTPQWMAPEVLRNEPSNEKSDVFSFGVVLWELMTESIPWNHLNSLQVVGVVGFMDRRLDLPEGLDPQVASIIQDCWQSDPEQRPSFEDIIQRIMGLLHRAALVSIQTSSEP